MSLSTYPAKSVRNKAILIIALVLLADQILKVYIKLNFQIGESVKVFDWFYIYFIENNGMAFGMEIFGKLFLTLFRIVAVGFLGYFIHVLIKREARQGFVLTVALVLAGAAGNIIDSVFYGVLFSESTPYSIAAFLPEGGGYASLFYGKVVDMFYFPLIHNSAGEVIFFNPIFNIADSAITVSVILILLFFLRDLNLSLETKTEKEKREKKEQNESLKKDSKV